MEQALGVRTRRKRSRLFLKQKIIGYAFLAPTIIMFAIFAVVPLVMGFYLAFAQADLRYVYGMVGFDNFIKALNYPLFTQSFVNVLVYTAMVVPMSIVLSLAAAVLINSKLKGVKIYRALYYIPSVAGVVAVAYVWSWIFRKDEGILNAILGWFSIKPLDWLGSQTYLPMFAVAIVSVWGGLGGNMLMFLAALKGVSPDIYEAAEVDGAGAWRKLMSITLPSIAPTMYFIVTMSLIGAFQMFDLVFIMIPEHAAKYTNTPVRMIYANGFNQSNGGLGSAMSIILFVVIMVCTFVTQRFMREDRTS